MILFAENHIDILDEFGGCLSARKAFEAVYFRYQQILDRMEKLENMRRQRAEKIDLIQFQLKEIADLNPRLGEDAALVDEKKVLVNAQKLADYANRAYALLYAENRCVSDQLKEVLSQIKEIQKIDPSLHLSLSEVEGSFIVLQEAALTLRDYGRTLVFDPERLATIDERLDAINRLKRKHGGSLEAVLAQKTGYGRRVAARFQVWKRSLTNLTQEKDSDRRRSARKSVGALRSAATGGRFVERGGRCGNT